jgi:hypothetical protein
MASFLGLLQPLPVQDIMSEPQVNTMDRRASLHVMVPACVTTCRALGAPFRLPCAAPDSAGRQESPPVRASDRETAWCLACVLPGSFAGGG